MPKQSQSETLLPSTIPEGRIERLLLFVIRRMAIHGLRDAHATSAMIGQFGLRHREPLVLLRGFLAELARVSLQPIKVVPCCCLRMTHDEARILSAITKANTEPAWALYHLERLTGGADAISSLSAAMAINDTLAEVGAPVGANQSRCRDLS
jgi:hypothetical protein